MTTTVLILAVTVTWLCLLLICIGLGVLLRYVLGLRIERLSDLLISPWVGWCVAVACLQIMHLVLPVDSRIGLVIAIFGVWGLFLNRDGLKDLFRKQKSAMLIACACIIISAVWLAIHATTQPTVYDVGLYHLNAISWAATYPVVPGLGNLHGRLGFNSSYTLYAAMLNFGPFESRAHHLASGFIFMLLLARCLMGFVFLFCGARKVQRTHVFDACFLAPLLVYILHIGVSNPWPDMAVMAIGIILGSELFGMIITSKRVESGLAHTEASGEWGTRELMYRVLVVVIIATIGVTVKMNFAVLGGLIVLSTFVAVLTLKRETAILTRAMLAKVMIAVLIILVPWGIRGVILSGYVAYPSLFGGLDVDWAVPAHMADNERSWIMSWARTPNANPRDVLGNWEWLWPWFNRILRNHVADVVVPYGIACVAWVTLLYRRQYRSSKRAIQKAFIFCIPPAGMVLFCFFTAPDPRFAGASFWLLAIGSMMLAIDSVEGPALSICVVCFSVVFMCQNINPLAFLFEWQRDSGRVKQVEMVARETDSGLTVYVPLTGDQSWDSKLPATPYFNRGLELREKGNLAKGFRIVAP